MELEEGIEAGKFVDDIIIISKIRILLIAKLEGPLLISRVKYSR
ncbi:hypothetical protein [Fulvivirga maritima]|nr:hypothetical protein [Fulvivirga maritima]